MNSGSQVVQRCLGAVDAHDLDAVRACYTADAEVIGPGTALRGVDQIGPWYQVFVTAFPDLKHEIRGSIDQGTSCAVEVRVTGTHTGPLASPAGPTAPTGKPFTLDYVEVARLADGKIKSHALYWDNQNFLTQLGLL